MKGSSKKKGSSRFHEAPIDDVLTKLRAWAHAGSELMVMLAHRATSIVIRCQVGELENGVFSFFQPDLRVGFMASIARFTCVDMGTGHSETCMFLVSDSGEALTIFEMTRRAEDLFRGFPVPSSAVQ